MIIKLGEKFTQLFLKYMPDAFVFAMLLTLLVAISAWLWLGESPMERIISWYDGFFDLLLVIPIMTKGVKIQARDIMGYLAIPFLVFFILQSILVVWMPI